MNLYLSCIAVAGLLIFLALRLYYGLWKANRAILGSQPFSRSIVDVFSHVPNPATGPALHILAGASLITGLSLFVASIVADAFAPPDEFVGSAVSAASLLIAIAFSLVTIWTLWQARRIEFEAGYKIFDFLHLIEEVNKDISNILHSFNQIYGGRAQPFHRVYLVTTLPFLGKLSYPTHDATTTFADKLGQLTDAAERSLRSRTCPEQAAFEFHILCGDTAAIRKFCEDFYKSSRVPPDEIGRIIQSIEENIEFQNNKLKKLGGGPYCRVPSVPPVQFMIVGNKLFEFTLETQQSLSEIFNTQVVHDSRFCRNYVETFKILQP